MHAFSPPFMESLKSSVSSYHIPGMVIEMHSGIAVTPKILFPSYSLNSVKRHSNNIRKY